MLPNLSILSWLQLQYINFFCTTFPGFSLHYLDISKLKKNFQKVFSCSGQSISARKKGSPLFKYFLPTAFQITTPPSATYMYFVKTWVVYYSLHFSWHTPSALSPQHINSANVFSLSEPGCVQFTSHTNFIRFFPFFIWHYSLQF